MRFFSLWLCGGGSRQQRLHRPDPSARVRALVAAFGHAGLADSRSAVAVVRRSFGPDASAWPLAALVVQRSVLRHCPCLLSAPERLALGAPPCQWPCARRELAELRRACEAAEAAGDGPARAFASFARGFVLEHGVAGAKTDRRAAVAHYERAAAAGVAAALLALGWMRDAASGATAGLADARESRRLYERAAALGNAQAMVNVAYTLANEAQPLDHHAAAAMYRAAAALGHDTARVALARMALVKSGGVEGGVEEAVRLLRLSVEEGGRPEAAELLGKLLARPEFGAPQDVREASRLWKLAGSKLVGDLAARA
eukprot:m51a1_g4435 hypothetical protein (314) ;mRNA; f:88475-89416